MLTFIVQFNLEELQGKDPEAFADPVVLSEEVGAPSHCEFINKIMFKVYKLIHQENFPRVIEEMRKGIQLKRTKLKVTGFCISIAQ